MRKLRLPGCRRQKRVEEHRSARPKTQGSHQQKGSNGDRCRDYHRASYYDKLVYGAVEEAGKPSKQRKEKGDRF